MGTLIIRSSARNISFRVEWLSLSGRAPLEPLETPRRQITLSPALVICVVLHTVRFSLFRRFILLCMSPISTIHWGIGANCDHTSEWVQWVHAFIGIAIGDAALISAHIPSTLLSRSVWRRWEDVILSGCEYPRDCIDPGNLGKCEWEHKLGKIKCVCSLNDKMRWIWDAVYLLRSLTNIDSTSIIPHPLPQYDRTPTVMS